MKILGAIALAVVALIGVAYLMRTPPTDTLDEATMTPTTTPMDVTSQSVSYFEGTTGYFARPSATGTYPGVVMIHEWWGLNDHIKKAADDLAGEGYLVLAVDLFEGEVATSADAARAQVSALDQEVALTNLASAVAFLTSEGAPKIASLGWCFGGGQSLQLAASGAPLSATIFYYGTPITNAEDLVPVRSPVLGIFGDADQSIATGTVRAFDTALTAAGKEHQIHMYPGVGHAFANPSNPNFAPEETADAWQKTLAFLTTHLTQ